MLRKLFVGLLLALIITSMASVASADGGASTMECYPAPTWC